MNDACTGAVAPATAGPTLEQECERHAIDAGRFFGENVDLRARVATLEARLHDAERPKPIKWLLDRADGIRCVYLEEMEQRDGSFLFAVRKMGDVLNREGEWEHEPYPSSRDDDFLARARFATKADAIAAFAATRAAPRGGAS